MTYKDDSDEREDEYDLRHLSVRRALEGIASRRTHVSLAL